MLSGCGHERHLARCVDPVASRYVGQKAMSKQQVYFYKRLEKIERANALHEAQARKHVRIKPMSRGRSLVWVRDWTTLFLAGLLVSIVLVTTMETKILMP